jgi:hypothetical protein
MKSKSHFFHDLDLTNILEPADPSDKNYSATKVRAQPTAVATSFAALQLSTGFASSFVLNRSACIMLGYGLCSASIICSSLKKVTESGAPLA